MRHDKTYDTDAEYKEVYDLMLEHNMDLDKIIEVVIKSNGIVGVGIVTLKDNINKELDKYMRGY